MAACKQLNESLITGSVPVQPTQKSSSDNNIHKQINKQKQTVSKTTLFRSEPTFTSRWQSTTTPSTQHPFLLGSCELFWKFRRVISQNINSLKSSRLLGRRAKPESFLKLHSFDFTEPFEGRKAASKSGHCNAKCSRGGLRAELAPHFPCKKTLFGTYFAIARHKLNLTNIWATF